MKTFFFCNLYNVSIRSSLHICLCSTFSHDSMLIIRFFYRTKDDLAKKERILLDLQRQEELETEDKIQEEKRKNRKSKVSKSALSFGEDLEENGQESEDVIGPPKKKMKDPTVDTSFLPDREREKQMNEEKIRLTEEWHHKQEQIKKEVR
jgi:protein FAM50